MASNANVQVSLSSDSVARINKLSAQVQKMNSVLEALNTNLVEFGRILKENQHGNEEAEATGTSSEVRGEDGSSSTGGPGSSA